MLSIKKLAKILRLPFTHDNIEKIIEEANISNPTYEDFLVNLFEYEAELRKNNSMKKRIRNARFPYEKTLEELDRDAIPEGLKPYLKELSSLEFIKKHQNIIMAGNPGTGKSHTSIALGVKACIEGFNVYFAHVPTLIIDLKEAKNERVLSALKRKFDKYDLIILDELGYVSFDKEGVELLFNFISSRVEKKSTIITTNLTFDRWHEIFHDKVITAAIIDRLTHKSYVVNMNGESYRLKESKEFITSLKK